MDCIEDSTKACCIENLIKVDRFNCELGPIEKMEAHRRGILHRAFSICIFDTKGRWLLQRRSQHKYHSPLLLANSCCSHPRFGEDMQVATARRLKEELGIDCPLHFCSSFLYKTAVGDLIEHEYDHLYIGLYDGALQHNTQEIDELFFMHRSEIEQQLKLSPQHFAPWFSFVFRETLLHGKKIEALLQNLSL